MRALIAITMALLVGCGSNQPKEPNSIRGDNDKRVNLNYVEYREMCQREPDSALCPKETSDD